MSFRPRKKKIIKLLGVLSNQISILAESDNGTSAYSVMFDQMAQVLPLTDQDTFNGPEQDVIDWFDSIYGAFGYGVPIETSIADYNNDMAGYLAAL